MKLITAVLASILIFSCTDDFNESSDGGDGTSEETLSNEETDGTNNPSICQSTSVDATLDSVFLAFAFDVSGSMGKGDYDWHDVTLKWNPVTQAARSFLESKKSSDLMASMTFFPASDNKCDDESYIKPDVPFTPLPSESFGKAMDKIRTEKWRGSTPTLHVMNGMVQFVKNSRHTVPGKYVIVLVTDGYPQGCNNNEIESVVEVAQTALGDNVSTYVIGIQNPDIDGAPETVKNLAQVAAGGGTEKAFIIDTGNPEQTASDFSTVIDQIRSKTTVCTVAIPSPPDGRQFDRKKVRVLYNAEKTTELKYDQNCKGDFSWHYDNASNPTSIVLCESTCQTIQSTQMGSLEVGFTCSDTIVPE